MANIPANNIPWRRGRGYEVGALSNRYTSSDAWARLVVKQAVDHVDVGSMRGLGYCVSVEHARFMAHHFNHHGIASVAVWGDSPRAEREAATWGCRSIGAWRCCRAVLVPVLVLAAMPGPAKAQEPAREPATVPRVREAPLWEIGAGVVALQLPQGHLVTTALCAGAREDPGVGGSLS